MPTTEYVRVADKETGHHVSIPRRQYDANPSAWRELQSDPVHADGTPRPPKYKTTVSTEAAKKSTTTPSSGNQAADSSKE